MGNSGGHREHGELIIETAKRELFEETGCKVADLVPISDYSMDDSFSKVLEGYTLPRLRNLANCQYQKLMK